MSVLKTIKNTILNVPQDITSSFRSLTKRESVTEDDEIAVDGGIDVDAGGELLNSFQEEWGKIHSQTEENSNVAQRVDGQINELFLYLERQNDAMNQFYSEVSNLPKLVAEVKEVMDKIGELEGLFSDVEKDLAELEEISEQVDLHNNKTHHDYQLRMYKQRKNADLEQIKVNLASRHAEKVQQYETKLQNNLREKQQAFSEAYNEEMKRYKKFGKTEFKPSPSPTKQMSLAEVTLDEDQSALDDFLKSADDEGTAGSSDIPTTNDDDVPGELRDDHREESEETDQQVTAVEVKQDSEDIDPDDTITVTNRQLESSKTGDPESSTTGDPDSSKTGDSKTGDPESSKTGDPESSKTGDPESSTTGDPESSKTGDPESSKTGDPESSKTGDPESSTTGAHESSKTGAPESSKTGDPESSKTGKDLDQTGTQPAGVTVLTDCN